MKDTPEKSNRQIARILGVDHKTVKPYRVELEKSGEIPYFSKREDPRTGKLSQPAEKPKTIPVRTKKDREKAVELAKGKNHPDGRSDKEVQPKGGLQELTNLQVELAGMDPGGDRRKGRVIRKK